jgi:putative transposase
MSRQARNTPGGLVYHVLNRAVGRIELFRKKSDFEAFERIIALAHARVPIRILSLCVMPNHWHFVVWPNKDDQVTNFFRWLTHTHAMRWRVAHDTVGYGPLYQGRFKSFPVQDDGHMLTVCRYVERNPLAGGLVKDARDWRWSSLWLRANGNEEQRSLLTPWPVDAPADWTETVNRPLAQTELEALKASEMRGRPLGSQTWIERTARRLKLDQTLRSEGRPSKPN